VVKPTFAGAVSQTLLNHKSTIFISFCGNPTIDICARPNGI